MSALTHIGPQGDAHMVDVSDKQDTKRTAVAQGLVIMKRETLALALSGQAKKGDVFGVARVAGIMAAKKTHELVPLCHPLNISSIAVDIEADETLPGVHVRAEVSLSGKTGVEMEALTAVSVACLTIYDMLKAADRGMTIEKIALVEKVGGKSGHWRKEDETRNG
jgi:cyclic pyranopterin monophosphate synthase